MVKAAAPKPINNLLETLCSSRPAKTYNGSSVSPTCLAQPPEHTFTITPLTAVGSRHTAVINAEYPNSCWRYNAEKKKKAEKERNPSNKIVRS